MTTVSRPVFDYPFNTETDRQAFAESARKWRATANEKATHRSKITNGQRTEIRDRVMRGEKQIDLAAEFGISAGHICNIAKGNR